VINILLSGDNAMVIAAGVDGILLLWIAVRVVVPAVSQRGIETADNLWQTVKIIAIADVLMSLDNVIAIAAAVKGSWLLIVIYLTISIPLIVAGSAMLMALFGEPFAHTLQYATTDLGDFLHSRGPIHRGKPWWDVRCAHRLYPYPPATIGRSSVQSELGLIFSEGRHDQ
jgi:Integral membrane protein TerC family